MKDHVLLDVELDVTVSELKTKFRELASTYHPDHGGDPERFMRLNQAYRRMLRKAKHCQRCRDVGTINKQAGFEIFKVLCKCKGGVG